ncbi:MAG: hypothetical protein P8P83_04765 [Rickettsiaceae bacterium]|nr:hypothetical protein [Rickettsiaceae bacterium]
MDNNRDEVINRSQSAGTPQATQLNGVPVLMLNGVPVLNPNAAHLQGPLRQVSFYQSDATLEYASQDAPESLTESEENSEEQETIHLVRARTNEIAPVSRADSMPSRPNITYRSNNQAAEVTQESCPTTQEYSPLETLGDGADSQNSGSGE